MSTMKSLKESAFSCKLWRSLFLVKLQVFTVNCCFSEWGEPWYDDGSDVRAQANYFHHYHSAPVGVFVGSLGSFDTDQHIYEPGFNETMWDTELGIRTVEEKVQTVKSY